MIIKGLDNRRVQVSLSILRNKIHVGDIVELQKNGSDVIVKFNDFILGTIPKIYNKEELLQYRLAIVEGIEVMAVTLNFQLRCMTDNEYHQFTLDQIVQKHVKKAEEYINQVMSKIEEKQRKVVEIQKMQEKQENDVLHSKAFKNLAIKYRGKIERSSSFVSRFIDNLNYGSDSNHNKKYLEQQIMSEQKQSGNDITYVTLKRLNDQGRLEKLLNTAIEEIKKNEEVMKRLRIATKHIQRDTYTPPAIRETHCWKCKAELSSRRNNKCRRCRWLVCSCGACNCNRY
ncbi:hypothetical protein GCM10023310_70540 [Paenibacillus vulneris]|uniref:Uncharacterized protein n=1 Tax=Paenibacillus vulneris TaxID=1133364 RepID=A0ABW3UGT8_9BACL